jgi:DUF971 family protein
MNKPGERIPTAITADRTKKQLTVEWSDQHTSLYPMPLVRAACPCAACRGGHENMRPEPDPAVFTLDLPDVEATRIEKLSAVGSYGVLFQWEDGHNAGIYNWHYLRALCPCPICRAEFGHE